LYAAYAYARSSGDWSFVEKNWPLMSGTLRYFLVEHDWNNMQTGAREHSASSAIDMDGIGYEGALAYMKMAENLGKKDEAALGRLLLARLAVSTTMRWMGSGFDKPDSPQIPWEQMTHISVGLNEMFGFDTLSLKGGPDFVNGELALSLSWVGQYPELYMLHQWGLGDTFWKDFEYKLVEKKLTDWRKDHPGNRNNHPANVCAHLYQRGLLGASAQELRQELGKQEGWGLTPPPEIAEENAATYAMVIGKEFPLRINDWGRAKLMYGRYDSGLRVASMAFQSDQPATLMLTVLQSANKYTLNGKVITPGVLDRQRVAIPLPAGRAEIEVAF